MLDTWPIIDKPLNEMIKLINISFNDKLNADCESILHPFDISKTDLINVQTVSDDKYDRFKKNLR